MTNKIARSIVLFVGSSLAVTTALSCSDSEPEPSNNGLPLVDVFDRELPIEYSYVPWDSSGLISDTGGEMSPARVPICTLMIQPREDRYKALLGYLAVSSVTPVDFSKVDLTLPGIRERGLTKPQNGVSVLRQYTSNGLVRICAYSPSWVLVEDAEGRIVRGMLDSPGLFYVLGVARPTKLSPNLACSETQSAVHGEP